MKRLLIKEIENCNECGHMITWSGPMPSESYHCSHPLNGEINKLLDMENEPSEIPDWCPLAKITGNPE